MKQKTIYKLTKAFGVAAGIWLIHYILHTSANLPFKNVGLWLAAIYFVYALLLEKRIFGE